MDDTLRLILGHLTPEDHDMSHLPHQRTEGAAVLCALAQTCQTLSDIALDLLWRRLPSLNHLICCLLRDAYVIEGGVLVSNDLVASVHSWALPNPLQKLVRRIYDDDLICIRYYGRKVKSLGC